MRHALIMAGGSGTRLWPMSRQATPKQLIPLFGGKSLLQLTVERVRDLVAPDQLWIRAGRTHEGAIVAALDGFDAARYLGEPAARDTLNAVGFAAAVIGHSDPDAMIAVLTADHVIEPIDRFCDVLRSGFAFTEQHAEALVTFGIEPTHAATGYGYLQLGENLGNENGGISVVDTYKEKPDAATAACYFEAGPTKYLWNSGMFVWRAATLLDCIARYEPANHEGLSRIAAAWDGPDRDAVLDKEYPALKKISVDYAVMEPASQDPAVRVVAAPMPLTWLDVGSWPAFGQTCDRDDAGNALGSGRLMHIDSRGCVVASSDADHLIATIGCEDLIVIHTPDATLVCRADRAEDIKKLHEQIGKRFGGQLL